MAKQNEIEINTRLGMRTVNKEKFIYFPRGLAGFEGLHEFILLQIRPEVPFLILQSVDNEHVGLLVADPFSFMKEYKIKVVEAEEKLLCIQSAEEVTVLVTVSIPAGKPEEISLNLTGPILVNNERRIGLQVPQSDSDLPTQYYPHQAGQEMQENAKEQDAENKEVVKQEESENSTTETPPPLTENAPDINSEQTTKENHLA